MPAGKEAMTAESFDEDDYAVNLVDKEGYSEVTARMLAKKKKESLANAAMKIEINLGSLAKAKKKVWVKPTSSRKGHYREQEVGVKDKEPKSHEAEMRDLEAEVAAERSQMAKKNEFGVAMRDINEGDYVDLGPHYEGGYVVLIHDAKRIFVTPNKEDRYNRNASGNYVNLYNVQEVMDEKEEDEDEEGLYAPRRRDEKMEIDLASLVKDDDEEFEHLSPEERKKRQEERDRRQKERAAHRIARQKQHDEVESGIPEGE